MNEPEMKCHTMDRTEFVRDVYSHYWLTARDQRYGFLDYDRHLCSLLGRLAPEGGRMLEVAIGTGYPIADFLQKQGYTLSGVDISPRLIDRCRDLNPAIDAQVADAGNLPFAAAAFDLTYCVHATWYLPDLGRCLDEMLRVTRPGGYVVFDLLNGANPAIAEHHRREVHRLRKGAVARLALHSRNIAKVLLRRGNPNWHAVLYETPTQPDFVYDRLRTGGYPFSVLARNEDDQTIEELPTVGPHPRHQRLIIVARP